MEVVKQFNGLNGSVVTREKLISMLADAKKHEQNHIAKKIEKILLISSCNEFEIEVSNPAEEIATQNLLSEIEYQDGCDKIEGLGKAVSASDIYDMVTQKIIDSLEQPFDFKQEWGSFENSDGGYLIAYNFDSKKPYRGINMVMLGSMKIYNPNAPLLENPYYLTFKQIEDRKGSLRKGSKASQAIYFTNLFKIDIPERKINFASYEIKKVREFATKNGISFSEIETIPVLKYYNVFNGKDIDGINFDLENFKLKGKVEAATKSDNDGLVEIAEAEEIIKNYPAVAPQIKFGGNDAFFRPSSDLIQMPKLAQFSYVQAYYTTLFHEMIHSTGVSKRLDRIMGKKFGDKDYSFEELIAEIGASFLSAEAGILHYTFRNSVAYIKGWRKVLLQFIKEDNKFFFRASSQAQKAVDFILDRDENGVAAYEKDIVKVIEKPAKKERKVKTIKPKVTVGTVKSETIAPKPKKPKPLTEKFDGKKATEEHQKMIDAIMDKITLEQKSEARKLWNKPENRGKDWYQFLSDYADRNQSKQLELGLQKPQVKPLKALRSPDVHTETTLVAKDVNKDSLAYRLANKGNVVHEYYNIPDADIAEFLGKVEKKQKESVAITIAGGQGSMKTRLCFRLMNSFAQNYKVGHASIEEHPLSALYESKIEQYLNEKALQNISSPEIENIEAVHKLVRENDVIIIDSFSKLQEMQKGCGLDKDFRKAYDGKLFIIIYQLTSDGKMRGGSTSQFDGDIISFIEKMPNYEDNYCYHDKNRYNSKNLEQLKFNIFRGELEKPKQDENQTLTSETAVKFSFDN